MAGYRSRGGGRRRSLGGDAQGDVPEDHGRGLLHAFQALA